MTLREMCISDYQETIALLDMPDDLRRALKTQERVPSFIDNLVKELQKVKGLDRLKIKTTVFDLTKWFVYCVKRKGDERMMSESAKILQQKKTEDPLDSQGNGYIEELGVIIRDGDPNG